MAPQPQPPQGDERENELGPLAVEARLHRASPGEQDHAKGPEGVDEGHVANRARAGPQAEDRDDPPDTIYGENQSEGRRVGKEGGRRCSSRWRRSTKKKKDVDNR